MTSLRQQLIIIQETWQEVEYDGVLGTPPEWVPEYHRNKFWEQQRSCCRDIALGKYTLKQLRIAFNYMVRTSGWMLWMEIGDPEGTEHMQHLKPVFNAFRTLAGMIELYKAVQLGEEKGLATLTDASHSQSALLGRKFSSGRKVGTGGPIRKVIAKLLARDPLMKNPDLWEAIKQEPPRGWGVVEPKYFANIEPYFEGPNVETDHMTKRRFFTVCGEERKKITG